MEFSIEEFTAFSADNGRPNPKLPKLFHVKNVHIKHVGADKCHTARFIAPPSPLFAGINQDSVSSEPFPDLMDLSEPGSVESVFEHCIIHCHHGTCLELKDQETNEHNYVVQECKCAIVPKTPAAILPGPPLQLTDEILWHVSQERCGSNLNMRITLYEADAHNFLNQLKARFKHHPIFMQLAQEIQHRLPGHRAVLATSKTYLLFFKDVEKFFSRVIALNGGDCHAWTVSVGDLQKSGATACTLQCPTLSRNTSLRCCSIRCALQLPRRITSARAFRRLCGLSGIRWYEFWHGGRANFHKLLLTLLDIWCLRVGMSLFDGVTHASLV